MAKFEKFEDIEGWQLARKLSRAIYAATSIGEFARDYALRDQIRRAAISVLSNIAEGYERGGDREFKQFLSVAKGSLGEVKAQLYMALDAGYISAEEFGALSEMGDHAARKIGGLMQYLSNSTYTGVKFKEGLDAVDAGLETRDAGL